ncbi:MAG: DeoR/GlpR family DNA-binding transcription regulator [Lachnospiraceae bacterium]|nr:DeoR/GlpR family DNA-binding transcription regulator [Lachnospiraceae bacterium]
MFVEERQEQILQLLHEDGKVKVKELSERFEVTEDCIRKDLAVMEKRKLLKRTYGGAILRENLHPGHTNIVSERNDKNTSQKRIIAKKAVKLLKDGDVIFLDISTTNIEFAKEIIRSGLKVRVVSHMLGIANLFAEGVDTGAEFIMLGGTLNRSQNSMLGALTLKMIETFRFDFCFLGVVGADVSANEISTYLPEDGVMKAAAISRSNKIYLMMEKQKFDFKGNYMYTKFSDIDGVICEEKPSSNIQKTLKNYRVELL